MSTSPYFKCYPSDFLSGVAGLEADGIAVYTVVLMLIYDRSGPIAADYEHIGWRCRMRPSSARKVVARLVERGKLVLAGERLSNARAEKEMGRITGQRIPLRRSIRNAVFEMDGFVCLYCGADDGPFEIDHIHPVSRGGPDALDNLCVSCRPCNQSKRDKTIEEWLQ